MFNRPHPSKRVKSWRPEPGLLSHNSSRGFATTRWGGADDGFMVDDIKRTKDGFALDEYAQVPLSPQAVQALKRLQAMEPDDNVVIAEEVFEAPEAFQIESWNANAHLPFVVDAYAFDDDEIVPTQATEAISDVDEVTLPVEIETLDVQPDTPEVTAPDETQTPASPEALDVSDEHDVQAIATQSEVEVEAQVAVETAVEEKVEAAAEDESDVAIQATEADAPTEELSAEHPLAESLEESANTLLEPDLVESDLTDEEVVAPEEMAASVDEVVDDITLPEPVLAGIDPEVVAQREAEKFAEGLAQGIEQGERQAREAMQQEVQAQCTVLANVTQELHALLKDSKAFYDPLKRLALHLAEQIVKTELKTSTQAIEQLIQSCMAELDHPAQGLVVVELNPDDKTRLQAQSPELIQGMRLEAVPDMQPGSVRLFANDTVIEDLVEHRLETLAQSMLVDVATWKAQSALTKPETSIQDLESEDVHP